MKNKIMKKPAILDGVTIKRMELNVYKLHSAMKCQREIDDLSIQTIYDDWIDGDYYHEPIVNIINGQYRIINGQHTIVAFIKRIENGLEPKLMISCKVAENLNESQEYALFHYIEHNERKQSDASNLASEWGYTGVDLNDNYSRQLYDINEILNTYGYTIKCNKNDNIVVDSTATLKNIDYTSLHKIFNFISLVFPNDKGATKAQFLKAVKYFLNLFENDIDLNKFRKAVKATKKRKLITANDIMMDSERYVQYKNNTIKQTAYALALVYIDRVKSSSLPLYKFDMK